MQKNKKYTKFTTTPKKLAQSVAPMEQNKLSCARVANRRVECSHAMLYPYGRPFNPVAADATPTFHQAASTSHAAIAMALLLGMVDLSPTTHHSDWTTGTS